MSIPQEKILEMYPMYLTPFVAIIKCLLMGIINTSNCQIILQRQTEIHLMAFFPGQPG